METLGVMFGSNADIEQFCREAVTQSKEFFAALTHPELHTQMATALIRYCGVPKLGFLARTINPERIEDATREFDDIAEHTTLEVLGLAHSLTQLANTKEEETGCTDGKHDRASAVSKEELLLRISLPISLGGLGIRSLHNIRHASYFASLLQALPDFLRIFPSLQVHDDKAAIPPDISGLQIFAEMADCRKHLLESNAGNRKTKREAKHTTLEQCLQRSKSAPTAATASPKLPVSAHTNSSSPLPALHKSTDELWLLASTHAKETQHTPSAMASKLQKQLTVNIEWALFDDLLLKCSPYQRAAIKSQCEPNCSTWLQILPTEKVYHITNEQFKLAIRHRLGMLPFDDLRDDVCLACARRNLSIPRFVNDPDHLHCCIKETGASVARRHHRIAQTLGRLAHSVGYIVSYEPPFAASIETEVNAETGEAQECVLENNLRGDLLLIRHNDRLLVDVTVGRPTGITEMSLRDPNAAHATATAAEKRKHTKYDAACVSESSLESCTGVFWGTRLF